MFLLQTPSVRLSSFPSAVCPVFLSSVISIHAEPVGLAIILDDFSSLCLADRRATARTTNSVGPNSSRRIVRGKGPTLEVSCGDFTVVSKERGNCVTKERNTNTG